MIIPSLSLRNPYVASSYLGAHDRLPDTYGRRLTLDDIQARDTTIMRGTLDLSRRRSPALHPELGISVCRGMESLM